MTMIVWSMPILPRYESDASIFDHMINVVDSVVVVEVGCTSLVHFYSPNTLLITRASSLLTDRQLTRREIVDASEASASY
jgi:hypothetical protein